MSELRGRLLSRQAETAGNETGPAPFAYKVGAYIAAVLWSCVVWMALYRIVVRVFG